MQHDVAIVGAGIGGAVLALDLGRRGYRVALIERDAAPPRIARPEILWSPTIRALERFGIAEAIRDTCSVHVERIEIGGAKPWVSITHDDFASAGVDAYSTNPSMTRALIADAAVATGKVEVMRGAVVEELLRDGVRAKRGDETLEVNASVVVGDDGANSVVRKRLGIDLALTAFPIEFVTASIPRWPLAPNRARVWLGDAAAAFIPWPRGEGVLLLPMTTAPSPDVFWNTLERLTPMAGAVREQLEFPRDFTRVARPFGHVATYVANGAALIGDAAHPMTPAGGQGANASIADAIALADVLDDALRASDVSRDRLLAYERLRRPRNEQSISFSRFARRAFRIGRFLPIAAIAPIVARLLPKRAVIRTFATAFVSPR